MTPTTGRSTPASSARAIAWSRSTGNSSRSEYWILALPDARLELYRDAAETGYRDVTVHPAGKTVAPLTRPAAAIAVGDLVP